ncbi:MAG: DNA recombination protein RmuC [Gammaproteobacteria bacterium]|nr:DNA recombination protein RmuC [Gammaproteobacteria bacterium]
MPWLPVLSTALAFLASSWLATLVWALRRQRAMAEDLVEMRQAAQQHERELIEMRSQQQGGQSRITELREQHYQAEQRQRRAEQEREEWRARSERSSSRLETLEQQLHELRAQRQHSEQQLEQLRGEHQQLLSDHSELKSSLSHREQHFAEQQQLLKDSREQLKLEFEQLAGRIFEDKGKAFSATSQQSLDALLKPFREQIDLFRHKVEDIHHKDTQQQARLAQELHQLKELNKQITQEAHDLSTALRGQKKIQGNWGELILENVLERSGLRPGQDFQREVSLQTRDGQRQRPDVVVYLPQGKHLIIDAKVSLAAYTRYVNSEDEQERQVALLEHGQAIGERIRELADKNYFDLPELNAPEMVFMFIPIESAFVEALKADESLFQKAIERNVLVATPTTLLTSLNIVRQLWRFEDQNRHTAELAERAGRVYDKLRTFLGSMDSIGNNLEKATEAYQKACDQLVSGRGNLVKQVSDFKELGVSVKADLSEDWRDKAALELGRDRQQDIPDPANT